MDYDTWMKVRSDCHNDDMRPWCKMGEPARTAMINAHAAGAGIEVMGLEEWRRSTEPRWHNGNIYRVCPSWPGPANPAPAAEYEDKNVFLVGVTYKFVHHGGSNAPSWLITTAMGTIGFAGYVYEINGRTAVRPKLLFDSQPNGTYRLRVPKSVRFLKGATV